MDGITSVPPAPPYPIPVPDFMLADPVALRPFRPGGAGRRSVVCQPRDPQTLAVLVAYVHRDGRSYFPDLHKRWMPHLTWGARPWPAHWRRGIAEGPAAYIADALGHMSLLVTSYTDQGHPCDIDLTNKMTPSDVEARRQEIDDVLDRYALDAEREAALRKERRKLRVGSRKVKHLRDVYAPLLIFGPSVHSGLTTAQVAILYAATQELTQLPREQTDRIDLAEVFEPRPGMPLPVRPWVQFSGNGVKRRRAMGYRVATWMARSGYPEGTGPAEFLAELAALPKELGVEVLGYHTKERTWYSLADLRAMAAHRAGRALLARLVVRLYAPAEYLSTWRAYFAERLGYSHIPGGVEDATATPDDRITSAAALARYMAREGITQGELAERLGMRRQNLNRVLTGRRPWSHRFADRVNAKLLDLPPTGQKDRRERKPKIKLQATAIEAAEVVEASKAVEVPTPAVVEIDTRPVVLRITYGMLTEQAATVAGVLMLDKARAMRHVLDRCKNAGLSHYWAAADNDLPDLADRYREAARKQFAACPDVYRGVIPAAVVETLLGRAPVVQPAPEPAPASPVVQAEAPAPIAQAIEPVAQAPAQSVAHPIYGKLSPASIAALERMNEETLIRTAFNLPYRPMAPTKKRKRKFRPGVEPGFDPSYSTDQPDE